MLKWAHNTCCAKVLSFAFVVLFFLFVFFFCSREWPLGVSVIVCMHVGCDFYLFWCRKKIPFAEKVDQKCCNRCARTDTHIDFGILWPLFLSLDTPVAGCTASKVSFFEMFLPCENTSFDCLSYLVSKNEYLSQK